MGGEPVNVCDEMTARLREGIASAGVAVVAVVLQHTVDVGG